MENKEYPILKKISSPEPQSTDWKGQQEIMNSGDLDCGLLKYKIPNLRILD